ncbi:MAG: hypothetical protein U0768_06900 [Anaerolineae bacterium]
MSDITAAASPNSEPVSLPSLPESLPTGSTETATTVEQSHSRVSAIVQPLTEIAAIVVWAFWVGRDLLNSNPAMWPLGGDIQLHGSFAYVWYWFSKCGACVAWNGMSNGGGPAFAEQLGGILHPIMPIAVLLFGPLEGFKVSIVASLAMAGIAQWWLARVMGLGVVPRLWAAALVVVGGHLAALLAGGWSIMVLSTAASSLVLAPGVQLGLTGSRRAAVLLGSMLGLAILTGHGYMQMGLLLAILPPFALFWFDEKFKLKPVWKEYLLAGGIALLISAVYWLPLFHFWPNVDKPANPEFSGVQPLEYQPLNLVIRDRSFVTMEVLGQKSIFAYHAYYIGWIPILLAIAGLVLAPRTRTRLLLYFVSAILLVYLVAAAITPGWISQVFPSILGMRHPMVIAALAIPLIVGLSAWGLDGLIKLPWPRIGLSLSSNRATQINTALILAIPLWWSLSSAYDYSKPLLILTPIPTPYFNTLEKVKPTTTEWIKPPYGDMNWFSSGLATDPTLKWVLSKEHRSWSWHARELPAAQFNIVRDLAGVDKNRIVAAAEGNYIVIDPTANYASVKTPSGATKCTAVASAGNIDVDCTTNQDGTLVVQENGWNGWSVQVDGAPVALLDGQWLSVAAPTGTHHFEFRYRPWDAAVGLALTVIGLLLAAVLWWRSGQPATAER